MQFERDRTPARSDAENRDFASCAERLESYQRSELYRVPQAEALALSVLGFFYLQDRSRPNRVKCNFCRRTCERGYDSAAELRVTYEPEKDLSERLVRLINRHSLASPYCPFVLGVTADNVPLPENQFRRELEVPSTNIPQLCKTFHADLSHPLSIQRAEHLPDLDDVEIYFNCGRYDFEPLVGELAPSEEEWCLQGQTPNVDTDERFKTRTIVEMYCTTQVMTNESYRSFALVISLHYSINHYSINQIKNLLILVYQYLQSNIFVLVDLQLVAVERSVSIGQFRGSRVAGIATGDHNAGRSQCRFAREGGLLLHGACR